jgi:hypothetical protein
LQDFGCVAFVKAATQIYDFGGARIALSAEVGNKKGLESEGNKGAEEFNPSSGMRRGNIFPSEHINPRIVVRDFLVHDLINMATHFHLLGIRGLEARATLAGSRGTGFQPVTVMAEDAVIFMKSCS